MSVIFGKRTLLFLLGLLFYTNGQTQSSGVIQYNEDQAMDGYIFFSSTHNEESYLIDNCGRLINQWVGENSAGLSSNLMPDGKVLRVEAVGGSCCPQASVGGRIELRDWDNNLEWEFLMNNDAFVQHHDFSLMPNGNVLVLGWEVISPEQQELYGKEQISYPALWGEFIYELKPTGDNQAEIVCEWHLQDHFVQDRFPAANNFGNVSDAIGQLDINYVGPSHWSDRDWFHCNAIDYNPDRDEIIINARNIHEMWIIDHSTTTEEASTNSGGNRGNGGEFLFRWGNPSASKNGNISQLKMFGSHGHEWIKEGLPNEGKIIFFNNGDQRPQGYYSTAEIIDPNIDATGHYVLDGNNIYQTNEHQIVFGEVPYSLQSEYLSNAQQLENGNFFINEGGSGRYIEVNSSGEIVWEYVVPLRFNDPIGQGAINLYNSFRAYKYPIDYPGFAGQDMTPGEYIEITSLDVCGLIDTTIDEDGDGFNVGTDCDDNDPEVTIPGTDCDDNNPHTIGDIVAEGCFCQGECQEFDGPIVNCEPGNGYVLLSWDEDPLIEHYVIVIFHSGTFAQFDITENELKFEVVSANDILDINVFAFDISGCRAEVSTIECAALTSVQEENLTFNVFPNPTSNVLNVYGVNYAHAKISDLMGQEVATFVKDETINTSLLTQGLYFISLYNEKGESLGVKRFLKE